MAYPTLRSDITDDELRDDFVLTHDEKILLCGKDDVNRLGLSVLLKVYQRLGYIPQLDGVPCAVVEWVAEPTRRLQPRL